MSVRAQGLLARFAMESGRLTKNSVKPKLFEPNRNGELSVYCVEGLHCAEIRRIGDNVVAQIGNKKRLRGWGEVDQKVVDEVNLRIERDDTPERHANIVGWPKEAPERKLRQQELARRARAFII